MYSISATLTNKPRWRTCSYAAAHNLDAAIKTLNTFDNSYAHSESDAAGLEPLSEPDADPFGLPEGDRDREREGLLDAERERDRDLDADLERERDRETERERDRERETEREREREGDFDADLDRERDLERD